ncbi:ubiquinone biosynthesis accessory factor UbiJ [Vibrio gangliei]|uniref:ubiquinone biosynthesis accessory factor UbiJ n=1 Tax=Vibrio gangliei TaxID=2077090 RepID=UPI000D01CD6E|nr:SCP2 domain-containing protein [Vibrio gangliei]
MPFEPLVTGAIETTLNRLIADSPTHQQQVARLKGKVIVVHIQEFDRRLVFVFSHQIDVLSHYEAEPDCYLSLKLSVLPELKDHANITKLIKQDKLVLDGDIQLAQKFSQLMTAIKPDPEEWLSRLIGDVLAHTVVQGVKGQMKWLKSSAERQQRKLSTVLIEEWKVAPNPLEIAHFCDQVDEVSGKAGVLEQRIARLMEKA